MNFSLESSGKKYIIFLHDHLYVMPYCCISSKSLQFQMVQMELHLQEMWTVKWMYGQTDRQDDISPNFEGGINTCSNSVNLFSKVVPSAGHGIENTAKHELTWDHVDIIHWYVITGGQAAIWHRPVLSIAGWCWHILSGSRTDPRVVWLWQVTSLDFLPKPQVTEHFKRK